MMWEWDLPRGVELSSQEATSKQSWEKTMRELEKQKRTHAGILNRLVSWVTTGK
jgi:hypothetical protein